MATLYFKERKKKMRVCDERTTLRIDNNLRKTMKLKWKINKVKIKDKNKNLKIFIKKLLQNFFF